jgi:hypothetical protein
MRRSYAVGSLVGAFAVVATGCASSPGAFASAKTQASPAVASSSTTHIDLAALRDSLRAQQIADQEGPRVSIHAELSSFASSRRVRTTFRLEDDAYVAVGHLGPDGVVRIIFPMDPSDNGLVEGGKTYRLPEISAGYLDMYRWRNSMYSSMYRSPSAQHDSYDAGYGYVFVIAAWRPMRFDRFSESGEWNSFEIANEVYLRDPRPAIYELATLLTGENREAYTVKFANYFSTNSGWSYGSSSFASMYCMGYEPLGYSIFGNSDAWGLAAFNPRRSYYGANSGYFFYGSTRYAYRYDPAQGCYRTYLAPVVQYADGFPAFVPKGPLTPGDTNSAGGNNPGSRRATPIGGILPRLRDNPRQPKNAAPAEVAPSAEYRRRGLITDNAGVDRAARPVAGSPTGSYARPAIQEMMNRRREMANQSATDRNSSDAAYRPSSRNGGVNGRQGGNAYNPPSRFEAPRREPGSETRTEPQGDSFSRPSPAPSARPETPRSEPIRTEIRRPEAPPRPAESRPPEPAPAARQPESAPARPPESAPARPPEPAPASRPPGDRQR